MSYEPKIGDIVCHISLPEMPGKVVQIDEERVFINGDTEDGKAWLRHGFIARTLSNGIVLVGIRKDYCVHVPTNVYLFSKAHSKYIRWEFS